LTDDVLMDLIIHDLPNSLSVNSRQPHTIGGGAENTNRSTQGTISGGLQCMILTNSDGSVIAGGVLNIIGTNSGQASIGGGRENAIYNTAGYAWIGGGSANEIEDGAAWGSIGGGHGNRIETVTGQATIGGGWENIIDAHSSYSVIAGGWTNYIGVNAGVASILGGAANWIEGDAGGFSISVIGGGQGNGILTNSVGGFIGGGVANIIRSNTYNCVIVGGNNNVVLKNSRSSGILAGQFNEVGATNSMVGGYRAKANYNGCFVWGDSSAEADITSSNANQFIVRAKGGIWFGNNSSPTINATNLIDTSTGAALTTGGTWVNNSDRDSKENFHSVDRKEILERVNRLDIQSWNYKAEGGSVRHIGPMAQDFFKAFRLGLDDKHISTLDAEGVALAAIQALHSMLAEKSERVAKLEQELKLLTKTVAEQKQANSRLENKLSAVERAVSTLEKRSEDLTSVTAAN